MTNFVYAARMELPAQVFVKFGLTANPMRREMELNVYSPGRVEMISVTPAMKRADAFRLDGGSQNIANLQRKGIDG